MARVIIDTIRQPLPPEPPKRYRVELDLSLEEAKGLVAIARRIGGDPQGPRAVFDQISAGLSANGVPNGDDTIRKGCDMDVIRFKPAPGAAE